MGNESKIELDSGLESIFEAHRDARTDRIPAWHMSEDLPLGAQVYKYLRELMSSGALRPGSSVQTKTLAQHLGVSKTPLRDALIQLQTEGFLRIYPQRGVVIATLSVDELKDIIDVLGGLESKAMILAVPRMTQSDMDHMRAINHQLYELLPQSGAVYRQYNKLNIDFHNIFVNLCGNDLLISQIQVLKERMYHFPDRDYGDAWRQINADEHQILIDHIERRDALSAADFMRDIHWSFGVRKRMVPQP